MKMIFLKLAVCIGAILSAAAIWLGLMLSLRYSGSSDLVTIGVYLSHLSIFGWLLFLALIMVLYKLAIKKLIPPSVK
jgi:hypothetical protein